MFYAMSLVAVLASLIALMFAWRLTVQYRKRKKTSLLLWAVAMGLYALAAFGEFYGLAFGMTPLIYKAYYFGAVSLVAVMAAGQVYFVSEKWGPVFLGTAAVGLIAFLAHLGMVAVDAALLPGAGTVAGGEAMPPAIRKVYPPLLSGIGGTVLILGAFLSWWKTRRRPALMIVAGALVLMAAGRLAKMGFPQWLPLSELIGIAIMYYGVAGSQQNTPQTSASGV